MDLNTFVKVLLKAYIKNMKPEAAKERLEGLDADALAALIEEAKAAAGISAMEWKAEEGERHLQSAIDFIRDFLPDLDGKEFVRNMNVEIEEFVTDCQFTIA